MVFGSWDRVEVAEPPLLLQTNKKADRAKWKDHTHKQGVPETTQRVREASLGV